MLIIKSRERENKMNVRVIKDADGVAQNMVASLGVTGLSLPADRNNGSSGSRPSMRNLET